MTKFTEFYNRQKNVIKSSIAKRLEAGIPITEERDAFYRGELFKKYDIVESEGKKYTVLEQASNYYHVVDEEGNLSRKFPKQLTRAEGTFTINGKCFHGYKIVSEEAQQYLKESYKKQPCEAWTLDKDDVGILKQLKQLDEQMDSSYKSKDKLTVAKIIADAVGVPHDMVSTPENLIAAAIRKAKKDPKLVKNKEILANMLQIAREVGIKITDDTFVTESEEIEEAILSYDEFTKGRGPIEKKTDAELQDHLKKKVSGPGAATWRKKIKDEIERRKNVKESEDLEEALTYKQVHSSWVVEPKSKKEFNTHFKKEQEAEARAHAEKTGGKLRKIDQRGHVIKANAVHESEQLDEITDEKKVEYIHAARASIKKLDAEGNDEKRDKRSITANKTYSSISKEVKKKAFGDMRESEELDEAVSQVRLHTRPLKYAAEKHKDPWHHDPKHVFNSIEDASAEAKKLKDKNRDRFGGATIETKIEIVKKPKHVKESEELDEAGLSRKTIDSYLEKAKTSKPGTIHKAIKRFAGQERAQDRVNKDELEQMKKRLSLKEMRAKLHEEMGTIQNVDKANDTPNADVEAKPHQLPHGHTLNPSNEIHRKQLIRKVRGDD